MKKIIFTVLFLIGMIILPNKSNALSGNVSINCNDSMNPGENLTCSINGNSSEGVAAVSAKVEVSGGLELISVTKADGWQGDCDGGIELYTENNKSGDFPIAIVVVKAKTDTATRSSGTIAVKQVKFTNSLFIENTIADNSKSFTIRSTINTLSDLSVSSGTLSPAFSSSITSYSATVEGNVDSINILASKSDDYASLEGSGTKKLNYGKNVINVVVKSESGVSNTYKISITRKDNRDSNSFLKSITISEGNITFDENVIDYKVELPYEKDKIEITAESESIKSKVKIDGTNDLVVGENKFNIIVTAENDSQKTYTITVIRKNAEEKIENKKEIILKLLKESELSTINVKVDNKNKNTILDKELLTILKESKKTLVFEVNNSSGGLLYSVSVNGKNVTNDISKIDFGLTFTSSNKEDIDRIIKDNKIVYLNFSHSGKLPKNTKYNIYVGNKYRDGDIINLYYYNKKTKKLENTGKTHKVSNSYVELTIDHCSEYILSKNKINIGSTNILLIGILSILLATVVVLSILVIKKIRKK